MKPLNYPEFTIPGAISIMTGSGFAVIAGMLGTDGYAWLVAALLIVSGVAQMFKSVAGTVLWIGCLMLFIYMSIPPTIEFSWRGLLGLIARVAFLISAVCWVVAQIQFHLSRKRSPLKTDP